ncbi:MAG: NmrA family NAD(P)-binding protein, partial [Chitinophagales bacterium]
YSHHLKGVDAVFCVSIFIKGVEKEIRQGINLANAAKENGIQYFLFSSVVGADMNTGIPHWESKAKIENHIKQIGLPYTIIRPSSLYDNFLLPQVKSRLLKGKLVAPLSKDTVQQFISAEDIGRISAAIFMNPQKYMSQTLSLAAEEMSQTQVAEKFSKAWGREVKFQKLPGFITRLVMGKDLYIMFNWVNNNDARFVKDISACKKEFPGMLSLEDWIRVHFK